MENAFDANQILAIVRRRAWHCVLSALLVIILSITVALVLPAQYKSGGTILIEAQGIPEKLVQTTVTGYVEERLQVLSQMVMSRQNLLDIINQFDLYRDKRRTMTTEELLVRMRDNISMVTIQAQGSSPMQKDRATVAFTVSYVGDSPAKVQQVANKIASLYLEENLRSRTAKAKGAVDFLEMQSKELKERIAAMETKISGFKEKNLQNLPELMSMNLNTVERLEQEIDSRRDNVRLLEDRLVYLEGQLLGMEPQFGGQVGVMGGGPLMQPEDQVQFLRNQYLQLKASLSEKHPDVVRLKKQLDELDSGGGDELKLKTQELETKEKAVRELQAKYSDSYPDVARLKTEIAALQAEIARLRDTTATVAQYKAAKPTNPAYISMQTQIRSTQMEAAKERQAVADLQQKAMEMRRRLELTPKVEEEYRGLQRDYETSQALYRETLAKLQAAREARDLEEENISEKLTIIDAPQVPEQPFKPNRLLVAAAGTLLGLIAGVGVAAAAEFLDGSVHSSQELKQLTGAPLLAVVPQLVTRGDIARRRRRLLLAVGSFLLVATLLVVGVHVFYSPLDVLWFQAMRKIGMN